MGLLHALCVVASSEWQQLTHPASLHAHPQHWGMSVQFDGDMLYVYGGPNKANSATVTCMYWDGTTLRAIDRLGFPIFDASLVSTRLESASTEGVSLPLFRPQQMAVDEGQIVVMQDTVLQLNDRSGPVQRTRFSHVLYAVAPSRDPTTGAALFTAQLSGTEAAPSEGMQRCTLVVVALHMQAGRQADCYTPLSTSPQRVSLGGVSHTLAHILQHLKWLAVTVNALCTHVDQ